MSNTDKLREIAEKYFPCVGTKNDREYRKMEQDALVSDLTALISEHYYPKEFVLWAHSQDYWLFDSLTCLWVSDEPKAFQEEKTTDELFEYWKEDEQEEEHPTNKEKFDGNYLPDPD
jgi:hypothetical protein